MNEVGAQTGGINPSQTTQTTPEQEHQPMTVWKPKATNESRRAIVLGLIDNKGTSTAIVHKALGYANLRSTYEILAEMVRDGVLHQCRGKFDDTQHTAYFFTDPAARDTFMAGYEEKARARRAAVGLAWYRANAEKRNAQQRAARAAKSAVKRAAREAKKQADQQAKEERRQKLERSHAVSAAARAAQRLAVEARKAQREEARQLKAAKRSEAEAANALAAGMRKQAATAKAPTTLPPALQPGEGDTSRAKITAAPKPRGRYEIDDAPKFFSAFRPGQQVLAATSCAARALEAA